MTSNICFVVAVGYKISLYYMQGILLFVANCLQKNVRRPFMLNKFLKLQS